MGRSFHRRLGVRMIEGLLKTGVAAPPFDQGMNDLNQRYGVETPQASEHPAAYEKSPRVVFNAK